MLKRSYIEMMGILAALKEFSGSVPFFFRLYCENRLIGAQNFVLGCQLQMLALTFLYFKAQIFVKRLAYGFPFSECWPRK
jgi:hypothetical protein